jgi:predicted amidohydrolase YtcJ
MNMLKFCGAAMLGALLATAAPVSAAPADLIVYNGKIFTANASSSVTQAFAVSGGKFIDVGDSQAVLSRNRGPRK